MDFKDILTVVLGAGSITALVAGIINIRLYRLKRKDEKDDKKEDKDDLLKYGVRLLMRSYLSDKARKHISNGHIIYEDLKEILEQHEYYKKLGGNGYLDGLMSDIHKLPKQKTAENNTQSPEAEPAKKQKPEILIVDDSPQSLFVVEEALKNDYNAVLMNNPKEVMPYLLKNTPQLFILDYLMPEITGFDLIKTIRAYPKHKQTPIIILTSADDSEICREALELGACEYLTKPFKLSDIKEVVARHIQN